MDRALLFRLGLALLGHFRLGRSRLDRGHFRDDLGTCRGDADDDAMWILFDLHTFRQLQVGDADLLVRAEVVAEVATPEAAVAEPEVAKKGKTETEE